MEGNAHFADIEAVWRGQRGMVESSGEMEAKPRVEVVESCQWKWWSCGSGRKQSCGSGSGSGGGGGSGSEVDMTVRTEEGRRGGSDCMVYEND